MFFILRTNKHVHNNDSANKLSVLYHLIKHNDSFPASIWTIMILFYQSITFLFQRCVYVCDNEISLHII